MREREIRKAERKKLFQTELLFFAFNTHLSLFSLIFWVYMYKEIYRERETERDREREVERERDVEKQEEKQHICDSTSFLDLTILSLFG